MNTIRISKWHRTSHPPSDIGENNRILGPEYLHLFDLRGSELTD